MNAIMRAPSHYSSRSLRRRGASWAGTSQDPIDHESVWHGFTSTKVSMRRLSYWSVPHLTAEGMTTTDTWNLPSMKAYSAPACWSKEICRGGGAAGFLVMKECFSGRPPCLSTGRSKLCTPENGSLNFTRLGKGGESGRVAAENYSEQVSTVGAVEMQSQFSQQTLPGHVAKYSRKNLLRLPFI